jgi:hypothetical protein
MVAPSTPSLDGAVLVGSHGDVSSVALGGPAWYAFLEEATTFVFTSAQAASPPAKSAVGSVAGIGKPTAGEQADCTAPIWAIR